MLDQAVIKILDNLRYQEKSDYFSDSQIYFVIRRHKSY